MKLLQKSSAPIKPMLVRRKKLTGAGFPLHDYLQEMREESN